MRGLVFLFSMLSLAMLLVGCSKADNSTSGLQPFSAHSGDSGIISDLEASIRELQAPQGVDGILFETLKDELARQLKARGTGKFVSAAPVGPTNTVNDLAIVDNGDGTFNLTWSYRNTGDYDQNGEVGVADITPIALHFGHVETISWNDSQDPVIDGDGNGEIGVSDITPIAINFLVECFDYAIQTSSSPGGPFTTIGSVFRSSASGAGRLIFNVTLPEGALSYIRVVPRDSSGASGAPSVVISTAPEPPTVLGVSPLEGDANEVVVFSASVAGTPPFTYSWNFGGGAIPNTSTASSPAATLGDPGTYSASVTVTNDIGSDTFDFNLTVNAGGVSPEITFVTPTEGLIGSQITITATVTGDPPLTYAWDFGGGATPNTSADASPTITLSETPGEFAASLLVTNPFGSDQLDFNLHVTDEDTVPPTWDSTIGITGFETIPNTNKLRVTWGRATDNSPDDVNYVIYFNKTADWNIADLQNMPQEGIWWITLADPPPYEYELIGLEPGVSYTALVRAQDRAIPVRNEDTNEITMVATVSATGLLIADMVPNPLEPTKGQVVTITTSVSNGNGTYTAEWTDDNESAGFFLSPTVNGSNISVQWGSALDDSWYDIYVTVTDGLGRSGTKRYDGLYVAPGGSALSFADDIYTPFIGTRCGPCHVGGSSGGLNMGSSSIAYSNLVGKNSNGSSFKRVEPFDPERSYLILKLLGRNISGQRMPEGGPFFSDEDMNTVSQWIFGGALP
ncbi:MAG: PKD domain-containing protein [bacterium]